MSMRVLTHGGFSPVIHPSAFIAEGAYVIGNVEIREDASVWFHSVLRGDINSITIGERTNIQDGAIFHVTHELPVCVGKDPCEPGGGPSTPGYGSLAGVHWRKCDNFAARHGI